MLPEIKINTQLVIEPKSPEYPGRYLSTLEDFDDKAFYISVPLSKQHIVPIRVGTVLDIYFTDMNKSYFFQATVIDRKTDPFPMLVISKPIQIDIRERRKYFRCKTSIPIFVKVNNKNASEYLGVPNGIKTITRNISGGGMLFSSTLPFPSGIILQIEMHLPSLPAPAMILCRVIRTIDLSKGETKYGVAVNFVIIEEKIRNEILKYIFDIEREGEKKINL